MLSNTFGQIVIKALFICPVGMLVMISGPEGTQCITSDREDFISHAPSNVRKAQTERQSLKETLQQCSKCSKCSKSSKNVPNVPKVSMFQMFRDNLSKKHCNNVPSVPNVPKVQKCSKRSKSFHVPNVQRQSLKETLQQCSKCSKCSKSSKMFQTFQKFPCSKCSETISQRNIATMFQMFQKFKTAWNLTVWTNTRTKWDWKQIWFSLVWVNHFLCMLTQIWQHFTNTVKVLKHLCKDSDMSEDFRRDALQIWCIKIFYWWIENTKLTSWCIR